MSESVPSPQQIQEGTSTAVTVVQAADEQSQEPTLHLKLRKPKTDRKVQWSTETVDNENMNKKKSKCCCIYDKPRKFGESSSDDSDDECDHCHGHVEKKKKKKSAHHQSSVDGNLQSPPAGSSCASQLEPSPAPSTYHRPENEPVNN